MPRLKSAGLKISNTPKGGYRKINVSIDNESFNKIKDRTINFSKLNDKLEKIEQFEKKISERKENKWKEIFHEMTPTKENPNKKQRRNKALTRFNL